MNLPQLPTDNLYKFIAFAGLVITIASIFLPSYQLFEIERQQIVAVGEFEALKERNSLLEAETKDLERDRDDLGRNLEAMRKRHSPSIKELEAADARDKELRRRHAELRTKRAEILINATSTGAKLKEIDRLLEWTRYSLYAFVIGTFVGLLLIGVGFTLWYKRVQVHQDALLRKQAKESAT